MHEDKVKIWIFSLIFQLIFYFPHFAFASTTQTKNNFLYDSIPNDTCFLNGMSFEIINTGKGNDLKVTIRNGRIKIISPTEPGSKYRLIRYVFSARLDEKSDLVRNYGDLVSFEILTALKNCHSGDIFYFDNIIVVSPSKEILDNVVKPFVIRKM